MMLGGVKEGFRMGLKVGWWGGVFFVAEEAVDQLRNRWGGGKDAGSTLVAGLGVSGGFALWSKSRLSILFAMAMSEESTLF